MTTNWLIVAALVQVLEDEWIHLIITLFSVKKSGQKSHSQLYSFIVTLINQWKSCRVLSSEVWGSKSLNQARLIAWTRPTSEVDQARSWIYLLCLSLMWKLVYLISFLGKLHCTRDVSYLLGAFFFFPFFFRRALVRSRLVRELLRLARGH